MLDTKIQEKFDKSLSDIFEKSWECSRNVVNESLRNNLIDFHSDGMTYFFYKMWLEMDQLLKSGFWTSKEILVLLAEQNRHCVQLGSDISSEFYEYCSKILQEKVKNKVKSQNYECLQKAS